MSVGSFTEDDVKYLVEHWRAKPNELQAAIWQQREGYFGTPKFAPTIISPNVVVLAGNDDDILFGVVITSQNCHSEIIHAFMAVRGFIHYLNSVKTPEPEQLRLKLQMFLPPDAICSQVQTGIEGVPVEWFQWIPVDEDNIRIDKHAGIPLTPDEGNAKTTIRRLLGHLKWWEQAIRSDAGTEPPYRTALLVYNAVTLLDWHFTTPDKDSSQQLGNEMARKKSAQVIQDLADVAQACVEKTEHATDKKAKKELAKLADAIGPNVEELTEQCAVDAVLVDLALRVAEFEKPLKPAALVSEWVAKNGQGVTRDTRQVPRRSGAGAYVLRSLIPVFAAEKLFDDGKLSAEAFNAVRQTCADWVEPAIDIAVADSKGKAKKRWRKIGSNLVEALGAPVTPISRERET